MKHPIQKPVLVKGVLRFTENAIVNNMLDKLRSFGYDLNDLHAEFNHLPKEDWDQFNQLIGYSISAAPISLAICEAAEAMHVHGYTEEEARALRAEKELADVRHGMRHGVALLFEKCIEDLEVEL